MTIVRNATVFVGDDHAAAVEDATRVYQSGRGDQRRHWRRIAECDCRFAARNAARVSRRSRRGASITCASGFRHLNTKRNLRSSSWYLSPPWITSLRLDDVERSPVGVGETDDLVATGWNVRVSDGDASLAELGDGLAQVSNGKADRQLRARSRGLAGGVEADGQARRLDLGPLVAGRNPNGKPRVCV